MSKKLNEENATVLILSGNVHFSEISTYKFKNKKVLDFTSSGLIHTNSNYADIENDYRLKSPYVDLNFDLVEIDWDRDTIALKAIGLDGRVGYEYRTEIKRLNQK